MIFYRNNFTQLWLNLRSNEELGVLDTAFVEDYNGVDGQISLVRLSDGHSHTVLMGVIPEQSPEVPNDYLRGVIALSQLQDGEHEVRGRVRDLAGNYSVLGSVATPSGTERVLTLRIRIVSGSGLVYLVDSGSALTARGGHLIDVSGQLGGATARSQTVVVAPQGI